MSSRGMGTQLGARNSESELAILRRQVLELRIQNVRLLQIIERHGGLAAWQGTYLHEPTGVRVMISTVGVEP